MVPRELPKVAAIQSIVENRTAGLQLGGCYEHPVIVYRGLTVNKDMYTEVWLQC